MPSDCACQRQSTVTVDWIVLMVVMNRSAVTSAVLRSLTALTDDASAEVMFVTSATTAVISAMRPHAIVAVTVTNAIWAFVCLCQHGAMVTRIVLIIVMNCLTVMQLVRRLRKHVNPLGSAFHTPVFVTVFRIVLMTVMNPTAHVRAINTPA